MALDDVDEVVDDPALGSEDQVEVAQPDVEIHHRDPLSLLGERRSDGGRRGGLADPSLA